MRDSGDTAYLLSRDLRLLATNTGWKAFALANNAPDLLVRWSTGSSVLDATPATFRAGFERAFTTGQPWSVDYECSSASEFREFRMRAECAGGRILLVRHSLRVARPHTRDPVEADAAYLFDGIIHMCMYCRRVQHAALDRWDWVPAYIEAMPSNVSHGICPPCARIHVND